MSISVSCQCGRDLRVKQEYAGKRIRCPDCKGVVAVPTEEAAPAAEQPVPAQPESEKPAAAPAERKQSRKRPPVQPNLLPWMLGAAVAGVLILGGGVIAAVWIFLSPARVNSPSPPIAAVTPNPPQTVPLPTQPAARTEPAAPPTRPKEPAPAPQPPPITKAEDKQPDPRPAPTKPDPPKQAAAPPPPPKPVGQDGLPLLPQWLRYTARDPIVGAAFSPDGRFILSGGSDNRLRLWNTVPVGELRLFIGHTAPAYAMGFSPDGKRVLSYSDDKTIRIWEAATGLELRRLEGHTDAVPSAVLSLDGRRILSGSFDKTVRLWDAETGKELKRLEGSTLPVRSVALSPDGRRALSGGETVRLWDVEAGQEVRKFDGHDKDVLAVAFSPDGRRALSGSADKTMRLWDVDTGKELHKFEGHTNSIASVAFTPDGRRALTGSLDGTVRLWDLDTGKELGRCVGLRGSGRYWVAVAPNGPKTLAAEMGHHVLVSVGGHQMWLLGMPEAGAPRFPQLSVQKRLEQLTSLSGALVREPVQLGDALDYLSQFYDMKIELDKADFIAKGLGQEADWYPRAPARLPPLRGVKLGTALQLILDQLDTRMRIDGNIQLGLPHPQLGYTIRGDRVAIIAVPPRRTPPQDESRTSPLAKKLSQTVSLPNGLAEADLWTVLSDHIHERYDLNVVIDPYIWNFVDADVQDKPVKLPPVEKAKLSEVLHQILDQVNATYVVKGEYVLVVAKGKAGK
jgi:hypothetical protein